MHLVLTLHSHLPYLLNHGRWPHGSDWVCEAALDTYLPLVEVLRGFERAGLAAPLTLGVTPILASQLANSTFQKELNGFFEQRLQACREAYLSLSDGDNEDLLPAVRFWEDRFIHLRELWRGIEGDLIGEFRHLEEAGRIEIVSSAATHGLLPLLGREESIALQLSVGAAEHERIFGRTARGCWIPECAYQPAGPWDPIPGVSRRHERPGMETYLAGSGFRFFFVDTHMAGAGEALGWYDSVPHGAERFDIDWEGRRRDTDGPASRSAYRAYVVEDWGAGDALAAFVREPRASLQVWSRQQGYPGDGSYLEFHRIRSPGGLKLWRVTGPDVELSGKNAYDPQKALYRAADHATHFAGLLGHLQRRYASGSGTVAMTPFDAELFGHWWFEGITFLRELFLRFPYRPGLVPVTASQYLDAFPPQDPLRPLSGSWGANGDFSMWLNEGTAWTWERLWRLEDRFWQTAPRFLDSDLTRPILAQSARELLLAQSSDWQFMISTGAVPDYAAARFERHCEDAEALLDCLSEGVTGENVAPVRAKAQELRARDDVFPEILTSLDTVLAHR